jgi:hypothetical protein
MCMCAYLIDTLNDNVMHLYLTSPAVQRRFAGSLAGLVNYTYISIGVQSADLRLDAHD